MNLLWAIVTALFLARPALTLEERHAESRFPHTEESHELHEEPREVSSNVGPGKAVIAADPERGFQLAPLAAKRIGVQTLVLRGHPPDAFPRQAVVRTRDEAGVYRLRDGWWKLVSLNDLRAGDEIATAGAAFLRLAELDAFSVGEEGNGH